MMRPDEARILKARVLLVLNSKETREKAEQFNRQMCRASEKDIHRPFTI